MAWRINGNQAARKWYDEKMKEKLNQKKKAQRDNNGVMKVTWRRNQ